jgi:hypothetical protein
VPQTTGNYLTVTSASTAEEAVIRASASQPSFLGTVIYGSSTSTVSGNIMLLQASGADVFQVASTGIATAHKGLSVPAGGVTVTGTLDVTGATTISGDITSSSVAV